MKRAVARTILEREFRMLVIGRNVEQSFVIYVPASAEPREITVKVTAASRDRARLGIAAPKDCLILRSELQRRETADETT